MTGIWVGIGLLIVIAAVFVLLATRSGYAALVTLAICAALIIAYGLVTESIQGTPAPVVTDVQLPTMVVQP